jgi:hypothetical protein
MANSGRGLQQLMKKIILTLAILLTFPSLASAAFPSPFQNYNYCQKWMMTAGGNSGGVATTSTAGFVLWATTTNAVFKTATWGGHMEVYNSASNTPSDFVFGSGTDCNTDAGSAIQPVWDSYSSTTGAIAVGFTAPDISSTTAKTVLAYYGYTSGTDQTGLFSGMGLQGFWPLGTSTTNWPLLRTWDTTSNHLNGTLTNFPGAQSTVPGMIGDALIFATNDYVNLGAPAALDITGNITVSTWVKVTSFPTSGNIATMIERGYSSISTTEGYALRFNNPSGTVTLDFTTYSNIPPFQGDGITTFTVPFGTGEWHMVTATNSDTAWRMYVDGVLVASATDTGVYSSPANSSLGGAQINGTFERFLNGTMDDARIYNKALHAMDVLTIYNNTKSSTIFWTFGAEETPTVTGGALPKFLISKGALKIIMGRLIIQ